MDILPDKVTDSWFAAELFLYALVPLFLASILFYRNQQRSHLPPLCSLTLRERATLFLEGRIHHRFLEISKEIGLVYRLSEPLQMAHHFIVCDATLGRLILEGDYSRQIIPGEKRDEVKNFRKVTMNKPNIITKKTHGEGWDWARKGVASAFSKRNLEKRLPDIRHKIAQFTAILDQHIDGNKPLTDFPSWMIKLTIDFISTIGFDGDFQTIGSDDSLVETDGRVYLINLPLTIKEFALRQGVNVLRRFMFWLPEIKDAKKGASKIANVGQRVLDRYRASHSKQEIETDSSIIGHLVRSPYPTELERIADVTIFMLAGHNTTAYQVSWIIIECIKHPDVLVKLRKELDKVFAVNSPIDCTPAQLSELLYLGYIINEGMRLRPVIANGSQRKLLQDIPYKQFILPKGSSVALSFWSIMRTGIQKPDDFIPERWDNDDQDKEKLKELFMPFASGRRGCVGKSLALLELKVVLATLFYSYDFEIISEIKEVSSLTLKPTNADLRVLHRKK